MIERWYIWFFIFFFLWVLCSKLTYYCFLSCKNTSSGHISPAADFLHKFPDMSYLLQILKAKCCWISNETRTNIYRNFWWGSEVPKIHPNFPQRTNAPVKPEGKKSERDSDRGGKCSVCDKQRGLNWGEKNLIREQEIPSQTKQSTKKVTSGSCRVWEALKIYLTLMGKKYGTAGCFKTSSRSAVTQTHPIFPFQ